MLTAPAPLRPGLLGGALLAAGILLGLGNLVAEMPLAGMLRLHLPADAPMDEILVRYSFLPRIVVALLAGAGLGLAGAIMQEILRNPIASPSTLGVSAGAQLALAAATVWAPALLSGGREWVAMAGGGLALTIVLALTWRRGWTPLSLLLAGLVVSLYCGAVSAIIALIHSEQMTSIFIWGGGRLTQHDWSGAAFLAPRVLLGVAAALLLVRPVALVGLGDGVARGAGLSVAATRIAGTAVAVFVVGTVVAHVGLIGFVGLGAPALARLVGARRFRDRVLFAPLFGAGILLLADQLVIAASELRADLIPVGAVTAALGAPLILWLLPQLRNDFAPGSATRFSAPRLPARRALPLLAALLAAAGLAAVLVGRSDEGLAVLSGAQFGEIAQWRWPRALASASAGMMLAIAGVILQRMLRNPLASPEVLGISSGATLGLAILLFTVPATGRGVQTLAAAAGATLALAAILAIGRRDGYGSERVLLTGIALSAFLGAVMAFLMVGGTPTAIQLLAWTTGSTYRVDGPAALLSLGTACVLAAAVPFLLRWLQILPLGGEVAGSVGVPLGASRLCLLLVSSGLTAAGTLIVGPLSFAGLLAPHLARMCGLVRPAAEVAGAALLGALVMMLADWLGRIVIYPWQIPAGLMAMLVGGPVLVALLARRPGEEA